MTKYLEYKEELDTLLNDRLTCAEEDLKRYIPSFEEIDEDNFVVWNGKLYFIGKNEYERNIAKSVGIDVSLSEGNISVEDMKALFGSILPLGDELEVPKSDEDITPEGLLGTRLYDKVQSNGERWDIVIEYDENINEISRYGTGYYYLAPGKYIIKEKEITLSNGFIIDYATKNFISLSGRHQEWNIDKVVSTREGLILNLDPINLAEGEWKIVENKKDEVNNEDMYEFYEKDFNTNNYKNSGTGVFKAGDIEYDDVNKSLKFNMKNNENSNIKGGYLELNKEDYDFSDGFTFELYVTLDRTSYRKRRS